MADAHRDSEPNPEPATPEPRASEGMPRWVQVSLIVVVALVLVFVIANLIGAGGDHGPGRHVGAGGMPSSVMRASGHAH